MKKLKLITTLTALGSIATATPVVVTGCSKSDSASITISSIVGVNCTAGETLTKDLELGQFALNGGDSSNPKNQPEVKWVTPNNSGFKDTDLNVIPANGNMYLVVIKSGSTNTAKAATSGAVQVSWTPDGKDTVTGDQQFSIEVKAPTKAPTIAIQTGTGYQFVAEKDLLTITKDTPLSDDLAINLQLSEVVSGIASNLEVYANDSANPLPATAISFADNSKGTAGKDIIMTIKKGQGTFLSLVAGATWTIKSKTSGQIEPLEFTIFKDTYGWKNASPTENTGGAFIMPGLIEAESAHIGLWNGVTTTESGGSTLTPELESGFTATAFRGYDITAVKVIDTTGTDSNVSLDPTTGVLTIKQNAAATSWQDHVIAIGAIDASNKTSAVAFTVEPKTVTIGNTPSESAPGEIQDGQAYNITMFSDWISKQQPSTTCALIFAKTESPTDVKSWEAYIVNSSVTEGTMTIDEKGVGSLVVTEDGSKNILFGGKQIAVDDVIVVLGYDNNGSINAAFIFSIAQGK